MVVGRKRIVLDVKKEAISVEEGEETVQLTATVLTSDEYIYVIPPPDRPDDDCCCIYGDISVTDDLNKPAVTLFSRPRDDPQIIDFGNSNFCYLYLPHGSDRALRGDSDNYVTFRLYENKNVVVYEDTDGEEEEEDESSGVGKGEEDPDGGEDQRGSEEEGPDEGEDQRGSEEEGPYGEEEQRGSEEESPYGEEDQRGSEEEGQTQTEGLGEEIADMKEVKFRALRDSSFELKGHSGFGFKVRHAAVFGARVRVEVKINREIYLSGTGKVNSICGRIGAWQYLGDPFQDVGIKLYGASRYKATPVRVGEPIPLDRHIVVAPLADGCLSIGLALWSGNSNRSEATTEELLHRTQIAGEWVHFGIRPIDRLQGTFLTNKRRTHTKNVLDGLFSVSITFLD